MKVRQIFLPVHSDEHEVGYTADPDKFDMKEILNKAITKLPDKLRVPLCLKDIEGLSYQEIADMEQCEIGTVKSRIFRAREGLREMLKPYQEELMR